MVKLHKNMKIFLRTSVLLGICITIILGTFVRVRLSSFNQESFKVNAGQYAIGIYTTDLSKLLARISPFDDYYYEGLTKNHIINSDNYLKTSTLTNNFANIASNLFLNKKQIRWTVEGKDGLRIVYAVNEGDNGTVVITRTIRNIKPSPYALGQSLVICETCLLVDDKNRIFFSGDHITQEKLSLARNLKLNPTLIVEQVIPGEVETLYVYDASYNKEFEIKVKEDQDIYYDEQWHLIEVEQPISNQNSVTQEIVLDR